ncbi:MAG: alpha/beta fold hydrolase [Luteolibacter sp.]
MKPKLFTLLAALFVTGPSCATSPPVAKRPAVPRVVLVHGFLEMGNTYKMMKQHLEEKGFECFVPKMKPTDGRGGLDVVARNLKAEIDAKFGPEEPINIVAFSMGGVASRQYLQELGGAARCRNFITISSPHHGTRAAWLYPTKGAADMRPGSPFLLNLAKTEDRLGKMPVASYRTPMDLIILPPSSSIWDRADNMEFPVIMHPLMLNSRAVIDDVEKRLSK